jgi:hypothetical protein
LPAFNTRFYSEGEKALKSNRGEDAVEAFLCYWTFFRGKLDPVQAEHINDVVKRETGFDLSRQGSSILSSIVTAQSGQP